MNKDFKSMMSNKSDIDLIEIESNYKKYSKDALIALLIELKTRNLETPNIIDIENLIKELETKNMNVGQVTGIIELHPNIERVAKLILLGIPISIIQMIITAYYFYQTIGSSFFRLVFSLLSLTLILIWALIFILAAWIKSGRSISRIIIGILIGYSVFSNSSYIINSDKDRILLVLIPVLNLLIECYILYLLFNRESSSWYASKKNKAPNTTAGNRG